MAPSLQSILCWNCSVYLLTRMWDSLCLCFPSKIWSLTLPFSTISVLYNAWTWSIAFIIGIFVCAVYFAVAAWALYWWFKRSLLFKQVQNHMLMCDACYNLEKHDPHACERTIAWFCSTISITPAISLILTRKDFLWRFENNVSSCFVRDDAYWSCAQGVHAIYLKNNIDLLYKSETRHSSRYTCVWGRRLCFRKKLLYHAYCSIQNAIQKKA